MPARPDEPPGDSEDEADGVEVMLGFVDDPESPTALLRHRFPSKVGGVPAWLDPVNLPTPGQLTCGATGQTLRFLLQLYCPVDCNPVDAFHRAVFLFVSPKGSDLTKPGAVRALRCQLPRANPYYSDSPAPATQVAPNPLPVEQQALALARDPWRAAHAEQQAAAAAGAGGEAGSCSSSGGSGPALFVEQELVVEPEPEEGAASGDDAEVQRLLAAYEARISAEGEYDEGELPGSLMDDLEGAAGPERQAFAAFQARCALAPEQCLRYCFQPGAAPLWPSPARRPAPGDVPPCPHCGAARQFEFQVMPQLLSFMQLDVEDPQAPDWGTIAVYSCARSCTAPPEQGPDGHSAYVEEVVWVQPS